MAGEQSGNKSKAHPMNGGHGLHSYTKNSTYQRAVIFAVKDLINEAIAEKLDSEILSSSNTIYVTDMGCSVGPNTFAAVQNIVEAIQNKYRCQEEHDRCGLIPEFQVFLNDHASNDFNTLFKSLPRTRQYDVAGVPGSFHGRLFPTDSIHIVHTSYALQWLSRVPKEVEDDACSPAWNKGRIHYSSAGDQTVKAYACQFAKDMDCFLNSRAQEVVRGGLIMLTVPGRLDGIPHARVFSNIANDILGSCLMDMAKMGIISEERVDSFNIPVYFSSPRELEAIIERNGCFSIERLECLPQNERTHATIALEARAISFHIRAGLEVCLKEHFGYEILDELFFSFNKKLEKSQVFQDGFAVDLEQYGKNRRILKLQLG